MDGFIMFIKHSCQEMNIYCLEDIAILKCVSKEIKTELDEIYKNTEKTNELCKNTLKHLGCSFEKEFSTTVLNRVLYLQYMFQLTRYYNDNTIKCGKKRDKLVEFLNEFTLNNSMKVFIKFSKIHIDEQSNTLRELLNFSDSQNNNIATKVFAIYLIYYFISKLNKKNGMQFIKNSNTCILGCKNFRLTCVLKANEIIQNLKNEITLFPYTFTDKVIRLLRETSRSISRF